MIKGSGAIPKLDTTPSPSDPARINLRNGRAGLPYDALIEGYGALSLTDDDGNGLLITAEGAVSGGPVAAGDHRLLLDAVQAGRPVCLQVRLSIIPDPRDLWKPLASDQTAPLAKPDAAFDSQIAAAFVVAASKRGRAHAQTGSYRDDHFRIRVDAATGWHILVVADGAGSATLSREDSKIACDTVMDVLPGLLADIADPGLEALIATHGGDPAGWVLRLRTDVMNQMLSEAALCAARAIEAEACKDDRRAPDYATTIVIAVSRKVVEKWFTATLTVGDGGVALFDAAAGHVDVLCRAYSGEFAGQTRFPATAELRDPEDVLGGLFVDLRDGFIVLAAMTDGITDPKFPTEAVFADAQT
jgi:hypothetical protein